MNLSEICIKRPVLAWVLTLVVVLLGVVGFSRLPLQQYPKFEKPHISVETILPGAGPEIVEAQVTRVIEEGLSGIEGIETITSVSSVENSDVSLELTGERDTDAILNDIRDRLNKIKDQLDDAAQEPQIKRSKASEKPIMSLALTSETMSPSELGDYAIKDLQKEIETVTGVSKVDVLGAGEYILHIYLDPVKLAAFNLTVSEVLQSLKRQSIEKPAGKIISKDREYLVTTVASIDTPEEYNQTVVATRENALVYLKDIGYAEIDADDKKTRARFNGKMGVTLYVTKQTQANPVDVSKGVKKTLEDMKKRLPKDISIFIASDNTDYIKEAIGKVYDGIFEATILVILVVFGFLRSLRASVIPLIAIPVSLIGSFFVMYLLGF
ncbi:MAG TPA: efflux RND transporter permease subunit, partial [Alphaproteobacteria bacterium]|nr:efflux RND transporter permease subunit [Alphaproteobacteria bacterium]